MTAHSRLGKVSRGFLESVMFRNLGAYSSAVLVGPGHGLDNAVVSLGDGHVLILTADPLSIIPSLGTRDSAWLTVQLLASDFTCSGVSPQFAVLDFNLPPGLRMDAFERYVRAVSAEFKRLGVAIVGGHTGKYQGCDFTIVGGGVLLGTAKSGEYVTPAMAKNGDKVIMTKGAAIATTGVLSRAFPATVRDKLGPMILRKAQGYIRSCSTVDEALAASSFNKSEGGVTGMHDATEGGVLGGLYEVASACGKAVMVQKDEIFASEETLAVCSLFGLDPLVSLSEGTLITTCRPRSADALVRKLRKSGIPGFIIGEISGKAGAGLWVAEPGKPFRRCVPSTNDPYWSAYAESKRKGWR